MSRKISQIVIATMYSTLGKICIALGNMLQHLAKKPRWLFICEIVGLICVLLFGGPLVWISVGIGLGIVLLILVVCKKERKNE